MSSSPLKLDLASAQCLSLELNFKLDLTDPVRTELSLLGSRDSDEEDLVFFHEDYRQSSTEQEGQKLHSWGEAHLVDGGPSDVVIEYLVESELEDQIELHHTDFTLSHLFSALEPITQEVRASFTLRFELGSAAAVKFLRLLPYDVGFNGGSSIEYRGAHLQVKTPNGETYDLWFDVRSDDGMEATVRFTLTERPTAEMPGHGLIHGRDALMKLLIS